MSESQYPVLPLRDIVVFPSMVVPLFVGRQKSVRALQEVMSGDRQILLVAQKDGSQDDPDPEDLYGVGTVSTVLQLLKLPDDTVKVLVEGSHRAAITGFLQDDQCIRAAVSPFEESASDEGEQLALARAVTALFADYVKLAKKIPPEVVTSLEQIDSPAKLVDTVASHLTIRIADKQELLEAESVTRRLERVYALIEGEISVRKVEKKIRGRVKQQMEKSQREYYLNEQMKAIQKELGEGEDGRDEVGEYERRIDSTKLSKEARERSLAEVKKLRTMSPMSAEATVVRNYLDWMLGIPWKKRSKLKRNITNAEAILDADHFGLEKVKERIVEYLAVQARSRKLKGPILCLVGPPGVGKTSLGRSVARATGRKFVRMSLGGVRDEAEIRGHRRTYIGSMPGKIVQGMKKARTSNPLFLLDEVDKLGSDWRGDPSSALLEVLDPEQNVSFNDHYLEVDYDLSDVMFVTTANTTRIPQALLDRMEVIRLSGYTEDEKVRIATDHLIAKQFKAHGLKDGEWSITEGALRDVIRYYTREAGVRNLEREIANLQRKAVKQIVAGEATKVKVTSRNLEKFSGVRRFRFGEVEYDDMVGITSGLRLHGHRRRTAVHRGGCAARPRQDDHYRQARGRHAGIGSGGTQLPARPLYRVRSETDSLRQARHPCPCAGGRHAEGWTVGGDRHVHLDALGSDGDSCQTDRRHDRRDHIERASTSHRRPEGETPRCPPQRHRDRSHPVGKRKGPQGDPGQRQAGIEHRYRFVG